MIVMTVMYPNKPDAKFDMEYYCNTHIPLVQEKVGDALKEVTVQRGLSGGAPGSAPDYVTVCQLKLDSLEDLQNRMAPYNPIFEADIPNFTNIQPIFLISEVVD